MVQSTFWFTLEYSAFKFSIDSDYTILSWRNKSMSPNPSSSTSTESCTTLYLHNPNQPLPVPPHYCNPAFYAYRRPSTLLSISQPMDGARSIRSGRSKKSTRSGRSALTSEDDGIPKFKKEFLDFHNGNGVRTVMGSIGPIKDGELLYVNTINLNRSSKFVDFVPLVRMLLKSGYRHVYISRAFAKRHGFIPKDAQPGLYGYGGLVK